MARYIGSKCKQCRREGKKLFLKGERCYSAACSVEKRPYAPGQHGQNKSNHSGTIRDPVTSTICLNLSKDLASSLISITSPTFTS